ncbi:unnamed protein product [Symbiodinium sp. CCMP2592]|nr:unnamed protein product [Symbiodinium sp. CCMP2592]
MGRGQDQWGAWSGQQTEYDGWYSQPWRGKGYGKDQGKDKSGQQPRKAKDAKGEKPHFPTFEDVELPAKDRPSQSRRGREVETEARDEDIPDFAKTFQKILNGLRKAEGRLRRGGEEKEALDAKWAKFQQDLKKNFMQERTKYMDRVAKLQEEATQCQQQRVEAIRDLQIILGGGTVEPSKPVEAPTDKEAEAEWDKLLTEKSEEENLGDFLADAMAGGHQPGEAVRTAMLKVLAKTLHDDGPPGTPARRRTDAAAMTPPAASRAARRADKTRVTEMEIEEPYVGETTKDPYMASPSAATGFMASPAPKTRSRNGPRVSIKEASKAPVTPPTGKTSLADKLEAARAEELAKTLEESIDVSDEDELVGNLGNASEGQVAEPAAICHWRQLELSAGLMNQGLLPGDGPWVTPSCGFFGQSAVQHRCTNPFAYEASEQAGKIYDVIDLQEWAFGKILAGLDFLLPSTTQLCEALGNTFRMLVLMVLILWLSAHVRWQRPFAATAKPAPILLKVVLAAVIINGGSATKSNADDPLGRGAASARLDDVALWMAGQPTVAEQLQACLTRFALQTPLQSGATAPAQLHGPGPPVVGRLPPEPIVPEHLEEWDPEEPEEEAVHISFWVTSPDMEATSVDMSLPFPLDTDDVKDRVKRAVRGFGTDWLDEIVMLRPQLEEEFCSCVMIPHWNLLTEKWAVVVDAAELEKGVFAFYIHSPITRFAVLGQLGLDMDAEVDVYVAGGLVPLQTADCIPPTNGCLIKVVPEGMDIQWASNFDDRLTDPLCWDPDYPHPSLLPGRFIEFQTKNNIYLHRTNHADVRHPRSVAREAFGLRDEDFWLRAPTDRPLGMCRRARRTHSIIAVVHETEVPKEDHHIVFFDLRAVGLWVHWTPAQHGIVHPGRYIQTFRLPRIDGYSVIVKGGKKYGDQGLLQVDDGEVLEVVLRRQGDISSPEPQDSDDQESDDSDWRHNLPSSSDLTPPGHQEGEGPFGPPPPQPVNRERSRSPHAGNGRTRVLELSRHVSPVQYDLEEELIELPHGREDVKQILRTWPADWLNYSPMQLPLKDETRQALRDTLHWSQLLVMQAEGHDLEAEVYVDGSYFPEGQRSGYGVAVLLRCAGFLALLGVFGGPILCDGGDVWDFHAPPALKAEQVATAAALLWLAQSRWSMPLTGAKIYYDCQAVGMSTAGDWNPPNEFGQKTRHLAAYVQGLFANNLTFEYTPAHVGQAWNELVDTVAKAGAQGDASLPEAPHANIAAFFRADIGWLHVAQRGLAQHTAQIRAGQWLVVPGGSAQACSPLQPSDIIPTTGGNPTGQDGCFEVKCVTTNIQGFKGCHAYLDEQYALAGYQILFFQETKESEGSTASRRYVRFASPGCSHWGTAIWISKEYGIANFRGKAIYVNHEEVSVSYSDPRLLILMVAQGSLRILLFSAHVPHAAKPKERSEFLVKLREHLRNAGNCDLILGGCDANGRPPPLFAEVTGSLEYGDSDEAGRQFAECLQQTGLWLPSTYAESHTGPQETFRHATGNLHRIDFIAIGGSAYTLGASSWTETQIDLAATKDDHWPAAVHIWGQIAGVQQQPRLKKPKYDRGKMMTPEGRAILRQAWEAYVAPPWWSHVDEHCRHMQAYITKCLDEHFAITADGPKAHYITEDIWRWRAQKLRLKSLAQHRRGLWRHLLRQALLHWQGRTKVAIEPEICKEGLLYQLASCAIGVVTQRIKREVHTNIRLNICSPFSTAALNQQHNSCNRPNDWESGGARSKEAVDHYLPFMTTKAAPRGRQLTMTPFGSVISGDRNVV